MVLSYFLKWIYFSAYDYIKQTYFLFFFPLLILFCSSILSIKLGNYKGILGSALQALPKQSSWHEIDPNLKKPQLEHHLHPPGHLTAFRIHYLAEEVTSLTYHKQWWWGWVLLQHLGKHECPVPPHSLFFSTSCFTGITCFFFCISAEAGCDVDPLMNYDTPPIYTCACT